MGVSLLAVLVVIGMRGGMDCAPRAGPFDSDPVDRSETDHPLEQSLVASGGRREGFAPEQAAQDAHLPGRRTGETT